MYHGAVSDRPRIREIRDELPLRRTASAYDNVHYDYGRYMRAEGSRREAHYAMPRAAYGEMRRSASVDYDARPFGELRRTTSVDIGARPPPRLYPIQETPEEKKEDGEDKMAMMAAVAMTELLGVKKPEATPTNRRPSANPVSTMEPKRSRSDSDAEMSDAGDHKKYKPTSPTMEADEEVRAVVHSHSYMSVESRNPSPEAKGTPTPPQMPPQAMVPRSVYAPTPPSRYHSYPTKPHYPHYPIDYAYHHRAPERHERYLPSTPLRPSPSWSSTTRQASSPYEQALRTSGLPRSLSFRKICSRCGKTRSEHGELGFGHRCIFQECGRCGAGEQVHEKYRQPMGISCRLTTEQGAKPGAAEAYERQLQELAARADLQKALQEHHKRMVAA